MESAFSSNFCVKEKWNDWQPFILIINEGMHVGGPDYIQTINFLCCVTWSFRYFKGSVRYTPHVFYFDRIFTLVAIIQAVKPITWTSNMDCPENSDGLETPGVLLSVAVSSVKVVELCLPVAISVSFGCHLWRWLSITWSKSTHNTLAMCPCALLIVLKLLLTNCQNY
jgi:hypothetical protein